MNKTVKFRMTSSSSYQLSGMKVGNKVAKIQFTRSRKVANGTRKLYGMFQTDDVATIKAMINHTAFKSGYYVISAHENDAKYIKKVFGLEIEDLGVSQVTKIEEMQSVELLKKLQIAYNLLEAERDELLLKLKGYETEDAPDPVVKKDVVVEPKKDKVPVVDEKIEKVASVKAAPVQVVDVDTSDIPRGEGISDEDFKASCTKLKEWNFETHKNHNQLKAISKFFGVVFVDVEDCIKKLTAIQGLL